MKRLIMSSIAILMSVGCSSDTQSTANNPSDCTGAKCDSAALTELEPISSLYGKCTLEPDLEAADLFFSADKWACQFVGFDERAPVSIDTVFTSAFHGDNRSTSSVEFTKEDVAAGETKTAAQWPGDSYPADIRHQSVLKFVRSDDGRLDSPEVRETFVTSRASFQFDARPTNAQEQVLESDLEFWPVVIWPTVEFEQAWSNQNVTFFIAAFVGEVALGDERTESYRYGRYGVREGNLRALPQKTFVLPVSPGELPELEIRINSNDLTTSTTINGPGYYLMDPDGTITLATPDVVRERGMARESSTTPVVDMGVDTANNTSDAGTDVPVDITPDVPDPPQCEVECSASQVCVAGGCVELAGQTQPSNCSTPNAVCDGEDADCASGHICADGLCRRLSCQFQPSNCSTPRRVCDGENSDCNEGNVCVDGLCRRTSCQIQPSNCSTAQRLCDGDDNSDCASGHVCADGLCRRTTCQLQPSNCSTPRAICDGDDSDCATNHACVGGICRRLACQSQPSNCSTPRNPCDGEASDCADGHVCEEDVCQRLTCVD